MVLRCWNDDNPTSVSPQCFCLGCRFENRYELGRHMLKKKMKFRVDIGLSGLWKPFTVGMQVPWEWYPRTLNNESIQLQQYPSPFLLLFFVSIVLLSTVLESSDWSACYFTSIGYLLRPNTLTHKMNMVCFYHISWHSISPLTTAIVCSSSLAALLLALAFVVRHSSLSVSDDNTRLVPPSWTHAGSPVQCSHNAAQDLPHVDNSSI